RLPRLLASAAQRACAGLRGLGIERVMSMLRWNRRGKARLLVAAALGGFALSPFSGIGGPSEASTRVNRSASGPDDDSGQGMRKEDYGSIFKEDALKGQAEISRLQEEEENTLLVIAKGNRLTWYTRPTPSTAKTWTKATQQQLQWLAIFATTAALLLCLVISVAMLLLLVWTGAAE
ncbi:unnamed protein product, partial [Laminaria digitata]